MSSIRNVASFSTSKGTSLMIARSIAGEVRRDERRLPAVAAEHLDDREPLVGAGARPELVDEDHRPGDRGREPDAVVGAVDVVVHRLRDRDDRDALVVQPERERERVVAADRDHRVDPEVVEHLHHVRRVVPGLVVDPARPSGSRARRRRGPSPGSCARCAGSCRRSGRSCGPRRGPARTVCVAADEGSAGSSSRRPAQPRRIPTISWPSPTARLVAALMQAFSPGTSPPPVRMPMRMRRPYNRLRGASYPKKTSASRYSSGGTTLRSATASAIGTSRDVLGLPRHHPAPAARGGEIGGRDPEARREDPVEGHRRASPLDVAEDRDACLEPGPLLDLGREVVRERRPAAGTRSRRAAARAARGSPPSGPPPRRRRRSRTSSGSRAGGGGGRRPRRGRTAAPGSKIASAPPAMPA